MNRRKMIGIVASVLVAALGTMAILKYSQKKSAPIAAPEPTVTVLNVSKNIPRGTPVSQLGDYVVAAQVPASQKQANSAGSLTEVQDLVANSDVFAGEQLSKLRFSPVGQLPATESGANPTLSNENNGLIGMWFSLDALKALNGNVTPGKTKVAVFASFPPMQGTGADPTAAVPSNHLLVHHVPVLDVYPPVGTAAPAPQNGQAAPLPPTIQVKLGLDAPAAERVLFASLNGSIFLGEEPDTSPSDAPTKIVERSNVYVATAPVRPVTVNVIDNSDATTPTDATNPADPTAVADSSAAADPIAAANATADAKPAAPGTAKPAATPTPSAPAPAKPAAAAQKPAGLPLQPVSVKS